MNWINPPEKIRRFTSHQIAQHALAVALGIAMPLTAASLAIAPGPAWAKVHLWAGATAAGLFAYHIAALVIVGILRDVTFDQAACFPARRRRKNGQEATQPIDPQEGKYSAGERGDYFAILAWFIPVAVSGFVLRWPGRFGIPGPASFHWVRVLHAALGAAWTVHLLVHHVPGRWLRASPSVRAAIWTGFVPLTEVEGRGGWVVDLVRDGVLVPVPEEEVPATVRESERVRTALEEGNRLARGGRYEEACAAFEEALRLYPEYSQARFNLGVARMKQGRRDLAEEQLRRFLADDPFNEMAERARRLLDALSGRGGGETR